MNEGRLFAVLGEAARKQLVVIESPFAGDDAEIAENVAYARACVRDSVLRGEAPIASHLLLTQPGILNDRVPEERRLGIDAGHAWLRANPKVVFYVDRGMTPGMKKGEIRAKELGLEIEIRGGVVIPE